MFTASPITEITIASTYSIGCAENSRWIDPPTMSTTTTRRNTALAKPASTSIFQVLNANRLSPASRRAVAYAKGLNPIATTCELM